MRALVRVHTSMEVTGCVYARQHAVFLPGGGLINSVISPLKLNKRSNWNSAVIQCYKALRDSVRVCVVVHVQY